MSEQSSAELRAMRDHLRAIHFLAGFDVAAFAADHERLERENDALREALREASMVVASEHNVSRNARIHPQGKPGYCTECLAEPCEHAQSWGAWRALLAETRAKEKQP